jgi:AraC-like DNA-binding protein
MARQREAELSIRLVWPFARLTTLHPRTDTILNGARVEPATFANPDARIPHRLAMDMLQTAVNATGDPALGLHAGEHVEPGDFDVLESVARSAGTLREAIECMARYYRLIHDAGEITLEDEGNGRIAVCFRVTDGVPQPPAVNDFIVTCAITFSKRNVKFESPLEVRLIHDKPAYLSEYERIFQTRNIRFRARCNAIVLSAQRLAAPMGRANPRIAAAFEIHARQLLDKLREGDGISGRVRDAVAERLGAGDANMASTARKLGMSVATLRRRLEAEGTSFAGIVDDLRRRLAERHLREREPAVGEIAMLLGFSNVTAFHRAFRRWTGIAPTEYRAKARGASE